MKDLRLVQDIPPVFYSFHEEAPFQRCIECERNLLEDGCEYLVEKVIRNYAVYKTKDVVIDYAICMKCAMKWNQELSKESRLRIQNYFAENLDMKVREKQISEAAGDIDKLTSHCLIKNTAADESSEYQLYAHCIGNQISLQNPPYMISGAVLDEVAALISDETRDTMNGFFDRHFAPDPSLMEPLPRPKVVLV